MKSNQNFAIFHSHIKRIKRTNKDREAVFVCSDPLRSDRDQGARLFLCSELIPETGPFPNLIFCTHGKLWPPTTS